MATVVPPVEARTTRPDDAAIAWNAPRANTAAFSSVVFGGVTSQRWPVVLVLSNDDKRLLTAVIGSDMSCTSGAVISVSYGVLVNRRFTSSGTVSSGGAVAPSTSSSGSLTGGSQSITARINRKRRTLSGTWHLHLDFASPSGQTDHCDSGVVQFFARL
jgi:hypothetical protein